MINIDSRSGKAIYEQIVDGIKEDILKGILQPGDKLPSVREMASMITTNPNTVSKAYAELERQRIIETLRGRGTFVSMSYKPRVEEERMSKLKEDLKKIVLEAQYMGVNKEDLVVMLEEFFKELTNKGDKN